MELKEANAFISQLHRHHDPVQGHRFSIGYEKDGKLVGVATIGRPVARHTNQKEVLEVTRLCTDGTPNACSALYSGAARIARAMGYKTIQTFILESEPGTSLIASGWEFSGYSGGGAWSGTYGEGKPRKNTHPQERKQKWAKVVNK
jgi:hypothetical protein